MFDVELVPVEKDHLSFYQHWRNSDLRHFFRQPDMLSMQDEKEWFEAMRKDPNQVIFTIKHKGDLMGSCGINQINWRNLTGELTFWNIERHEFINIGGYCRGVIAENAFKMLLDHAERNLPLRWLECEVYEHDLNKQELLKKFMFNLEGTKKNRVLKLCKYQDVYLFAKQIGD